MKRPLGNARQSGSVLFITLALAGILGLTLGSYLYWVRTQNILVEQSQAWNAALAIAEAGVEEALAQINVGAGQFDSTNFSLSAQANWALQSGVYGPQTRALTSGPFTNGHYSALIISTGAPSSACPMCPTIVVTGYTSVPTISRPIARVVQVTTIAKPLFSGAITAVQKIDLNGNNLTVDSYDSSDSPYSSSRRKAGGDVASTGGFLAAQSATIYGRLRTGPTAPHAIGSGTVGSLDWSVPGQIKPGWYLNDFNMLVPDIAAPYNPASASAVNKNDPSSTNAYTLGDFTYGVDGNFTLSNNETLEVTGHAILYVSGDFTMKNGSVILIAANNASLKLYVGRGSGSATSAQFTQIDILGVANPNAFGFFALPSTTFVAWNGNSTLVGTIYAPQATLALGGNSSVVYDCQGAITAGLITMNGQFNIHFDENLKRGPLAGFVVSSWTELDPPSLP